MMHVRACSLVLALSAFVLFARRSSAQSPSDPPVERAIPVSAQLASRLATLADSLASANALSGVVLLAKNGVPVFEHAYGVADREHHRANTVNTAFNLSSIGKRFTQVAVAQLVASGRLHLDSTIASVWPDYPNPKVARQVTIRELLDHRSGIDGDVFRNPESSRSNHDYLALFVHDSLRFRPGTREQYSNAGYIVLGEIISQVSHEDYYAYVREHVFAPAGMSSAGFYARDSLPDFAAIGYTRGQGDRGESNAQAPLQRADSEQPRRGSAGGGSYATAGDLLRFIRSYRDGRLEVRGDSRRALIAGGSPGSNGVVAEGLPGGYDLIVLENIDPPAADAIVTPVLRWLGATPPAGAHMVRAGGGSHPVQGAEPKLPDTMAGRIASEYLRAYNSGDAATMARFFDTRAVPDASRPTSARVETYQKVFSDNGRLEVTSVSDETPTSLRVTASGAEGSTVVLTFTVESAAPGRLQSLQVDLER
jgi:CubicO group peptidase (beta-lactamase class C family)